MISPHREKELLELEKKIGITFLNKALLNQSLTHSSYAHQQRKKEVLDNERLEFLGDAILKLVASEYLYNKYPEKAEGDLTKIRSTVISDETLAGVGQKLKLGEYLLLSQNEKRTGGTKRRSNVANVFEALIGAVYLDAGLGKVRDMILDLLKEDIEKTSKAGFISDYKSALQEFVQKKTWGLPQYQVIKESGPKHKRTFFIEVNIMGKAYGHGKGMSKKEAEQEAAKGALGKLGKERVWKKNHS
ncbi:MAG: ribonuclease III [Candidatus Saganbacteria bacterium]|nr:ribonuclease III [Candidatus Saganbacteria bacterium]